MKNLLKNILRYIVTFTKKLINLIITLFIFPRSVMMKEILINIFNKSFDFLYHYALIIMYSKKGLFGVMSLFSIIMFAAKVGLNSIYGDYFIYFIPCVLSGLLTLLFINNVKYSNNNFIAFLQRFMRGFPIIDVE